MMSFLTYMHTRNDTNQTFYIGKGQIKRAFWCHGRNKHWTNISRKHGHTVHILAEWEKELDAFEHEKFLILCFKDMGVNLVNLTDGGDGPSGRKASIEERQKNGAARKKLYANGFVNPKGMLGKKHTEETKEKMKLAHSKRNCAMLEETKQKISQSSKGKPPTFGHTGKIHSDETKIKISVARKDVPWTEARRAAQRSK